MNWTLYKYEIKRSMKLLLIFGAILSLYVALILSMYDPETLETLDRFYQVMPELMAAVGMTAGATSLMGFMISYLYGFILLIFPMVFSILRANGLVAKYVDRGSMVSLVAAPVKRSTLVCTQMSVLLSDLFMLLAYNTVLEIVIIYCRFPAEMVLSQVLALNAGLLCLHFLIGSICFFCSCVFSDMKYSIGFGAGIPAVMYIFQMLANAGEGAKFAQYFSVFTLFDANGIVAGQTSAVLGAAVLLAGAVVLYTAAIVVFCRKDLQI